MTLKSKTEIIKEFKINEKDTGSMEVQIALLTERITSLTEHFKTHPKDFGSKRGLFLLIGRRRKFLQYIQKHDPQKYKKLIERLGLRK